MEIKIIIYQNELTGKIANDDYDYIKKQKPDFLCLPEYFFHPTKISFTEAVDYMEKISSDLNCSLIGGTAIFEENSKLYNTCFIFNKGKMEGYYKKINLFEKEINKITSGDNQYKIFFINNIKVGILICADVLKKESWEMLSLLKPQIIFIPTLSPYKKESIEEKFKRDNEIFVNGALITDSIVVKVCSIGEINGLKLQGRSLICNKKKVIWRVEPDDEDKPVVKLINIKI